MSSLPRVVAITREKVTREFDDRGPDVCRAEITRELEESNPELLDMATRCARDVGNVARIMTGFCMFYRLLTSAARASLGTASEAAAVHSSLLPRVSSLTRSQLVRQIESSGSERFTLEALDELERHNPELLLMSHHFAEDQADYSGVMQGFALLFAALTAEAEQERSILH